MVASCGGHPKDICLYQAQKGLNLASQALKPGGHILLLAASPQGVGDDIYFDYVSQFTSPEEVIRDFKSTGFRMGAHKAYLFGRTLVNYNVAVFSDLDAGGPAQMPPEGGGPGHDRGRVGRGLRRHPAAGDHPERQHDVFLSKSAGRCYSGARLARCIRDDSSENH